MVMVKQTTRLQRIWILLSLAVSFNSCSFWNSFDPLSITNYSPSASTLNTGSTVSVSVTFSIDPDHAKAEGAFSLTADGTVVQGAVSWSGATLNFQPYQALVDGPLYTLSVTSAAETSQGNSLAVELHHQFRIGPAWGRPSVTSFTPVANSTTAAPRTPLVFTFSQPMNENSVLASFSVNPSINLSQSWDTTGSIWTLTPQADWPIDQDIAVSLTASTTLNGGLQAMGQDFSSHFQYSPSSAVAPTLTSVSQDNLSPSFSFAPPSGSGLNSNTLEAGWPINSDVVLNFSTPMVLTSVASLISVPGSLSYSLLPSNSPTASSIRIHFNNPLPYNQTLGFSILSGVEDAQGLTSHAPYFFWLQTTDTRYFPPSVQSVSWNGTALAPYQNQQFSTSTGTLTVVVSQGTASTFCLGSFINNFSFVGSGSFSFSISNVTVSQDPGSNSSQSLFDVNIVVNVTVPSTPSSGAPATIHLSKAFQDNLANSLASDYTLIIFATM